MCDFLQSNGLVVSDFAPLLIHAVITKQCNALTYHTMQCNAMRHHTIPCIAMQWNAMQCNAMKCHAIFCRHCVSLSCRLWRNVSVGVSMGASASANEGVDARVRTSDARGGEGCERQMGKSEEKEEEGEEGDLSVGSEIGGARGGRDDAPHIVSPPAHGRTGREGEGGRGAHPVGPAEGRSHLGKADAVVEAGREEEFWCRVRWLVLPEETHAGRRPEHHGREVFLTNIKNDVEVGGCIVHCGRRQAGRCGGAMEGGCFSECFTLK